MEKESSDELKGTIHRLGTELDSLVSRLEEADFDLGAILFSPETLSDITLVTSSIISFAANRLQNEIDTYCAN